MLDGVPLGFANVLRPGPVGVVAVSGRGAEVSQPRSTERVSGTPLWSGSGADLSAAVGGVMTELALDLLVAVGRPR